MCQRRIYLFRAQECVLSRQCLRAECTSFSFTRARYSRDAAGDAVRAPHSELSFITIRRWPLSPTSAINDAMSVQLSLLNQGQHRNRTVAFRKELSPEGRKRKDHLISRAELQHPSMSPSSCICGSCYHQSLITLTELDCHALRSLLQKCEPAFEPYSPYCSEGMIIVLPLRSRRRGRHVLCLYARFGTCARLKITWIQKWFCVSSLI